MLCANIKQIEKHDYLAERFKKGYDFLKNTDLMSLPVGRVDIDGEKQLLDMLDEIRTKYDLSILLSTHDFATLDQYADKVLLLKSEILKVGTPAEVLSSPEFQAVFHLDLGKGGRR